MRVSPYLGGSLSISVFPTLLLTEGGRCTSPMEPPKIQKKYIGTFESHTIRIGRKGSFKGIEFINTHLDFSSFSRLNFFFYSGIANTRAFK